MAARGAPNVSCKPLVNATDMEGMITGTKATAHLIDRDRILANGTSCFFLWKGSF
jgi:hypothetical protein